MMNDVLLSVISDLNVNLAAGFFGAAFIVPSVSKKGIKVNLWLLTMNSALGILFLALAYLARL